MSRPRLDSPRPSDSVSWMSPPLVLASRLLAAISRPVMPVAALSVRRLATRSTASSAWLSAMAPVCEISVMLPREVTLVTALAGSSEASRNSSSVLPTMK